MFWGTVVKENKPYKTSAALEEQDYPILHISNVALPKDHKLDKKAYLLASQGKDIKDLVVACLQKDKNEV